LGVTVRCALLLRRLGLEGPRRHAGEAWCEPAAEIF